MTSSRVLVFWWGHLLFHHGYLWCTLVGVPYTAECFGVWEGARLGSWRLFSVQPLIGSTIWAFSTSSALWVLDVLSCLYWHYFYQTDLSTLWWIVIGVNWLSLYRECRRAVFLARYCFFCTLRAFFPFWKIRGSVMLMTSLWWLLCHPKALELQ